MCTTNAFMYFTHHNLGLVMIQTLQQKIFGGMTIKLIINQCKFESNTPNTFVNLVAWISQIISHWLPPILLNLFQFWDRRAAAPPVIWLSDQPGWRSDQLAWRSDQPVWWSDQFVWWSDQPSWRSDRQVL
jgi:hypothetical protein